MLWLIFQFYKFFFKFFKLKKIQLMIEKYFPIFFFQEILTKVNGKALIEKIWNLEDWNERK